MYTGEEIKEQYVRWFRKYDWQWFCTLTFRPGIRPQAIAQLFCEWIIEIQRIECHKISWMRMIERGSLEGRLHIHALLAGTADLTPQAGRYIWSDLAGG